MSYYTSLSGLRGGQSDLSTIANNVANANSIGFKRSRALFGDLFASGPMQASKTVAGQGTRLIGITQQFGQGTLEATDKTLDLAIASFPATEGLRAIGDAHWQATGESGPARLNQAANGPLGTVRAGTLERATADPTEEPVGLIAAQRIFQANAQAIETAGTMTQTITNLQV